MSYARDGPALWLAPGGWLTRRYVSQLQKKVSGIRIVAPDGVDAEVDVDADADTDVNEKNVFRSHPGGKIEEHHAWHIFRHEDGHITPEAEKTAERGFNSSPDKNMPLHQAILPGSSLLCPLAPAL